MRSHAGPGHYPGHPSRSRGCRPASRYLTLALLTFAQRLTNKINFLDPLPTSRDKNNVYELLTPIYLGVLEENLMSRHQEPVVKYLSTTTRAFLQLPGGWFVNNAGWVVGAERTLLIDTCATQKRTAHLLDAVRADTGTMPQLAVLTHAHGDHANGAGLVAAAGGTVMATFPAIETIKTGPHTYDAVFACSTWGNITPPTSIEPITGPTQLDLGGVTAEVLPVSGSAHTNGDLVVSISQEGVLFAGDLVFAGVTPLALSGSIAGWLTALDWLADIDHTQLVPGHGPVLSARSTELAEMTDYFRWLLDVVSANDFSLEHAEQQARTRWQKWLLPERHVVNLLVAAAEVTSRVVSLADTAAALIKSAGGRIPLNI